MNPRSPFTLIAPRWSSTLTPLRRSYWMAQKPNWTLTSSASSVVFPKTTKTRSKWACPLISNASNEPTTSLYVTNQPGRGDHHLSLRRRRMWIVETTGLSSNSMPLTCLPTHISPHTCSLSFISTTPELRVLTCPVLGCTTNLNYPFPRHGMSCQK